MADQLRLRGGPTAQSEVFVGAEREVTVDTGLKALRIHDGVTPGGHLVELNADAVAARNNAAVSDSAAREALRVALEAAIATAESNRASAITTVETTLATGDSTTLASANTYTDTAISNLLGGSPELLNTLNELAEAIGDDADFITTINASVAAVQADVDANQSATDASIAALTADVNSNEAVALSGRNVLSGRLDVLETDPTTATALASQLTSVQGLISAVQTDVDLNEADSDAAVLAEQVARIAADTTLTSSVTAEATARTTADTTLQTNITAEETSRVSDVATLTATINTNEAAHVVSHNALQGSIDTINVDRTNLEERLLHAGLATGILYVSNFAGG